MSKTINEILCDFLSGKLTATAVKGEIFTHFSTSASASHEAMTGQYIDEIMADLEAGQVTVALASEGLEESAAASYL